ncbi:MAG: hypothetical protein ABUL48_04735 [Pseudorhodoplanes sp.]
MSADTVVSVDTEQTASTAQAPTIEIPKSETLKSETAQADVKRDIPVDGRVVSIADAIKSKLAARPRVSRYAVLAASIAIAAALGSVVGALAGAAWMRQTPETSATPTMNANALNKTLSQLSADVTSLKSALDTTSKATSTQLSRINERVERAEKSQTEAAQKAARLSDTPKSSAQFMSDVTGSIGSTIEKQQARPPIVDGWVIRDIFDGRAMVESRHGIYEVTPGAPLPGIGRVEAIRRQDGRWVVVTPKGLIVSAR